MSLAFCDLGHCLSFPSLSFPFVSWEADEDVPAGLLRELWSEGY